jgi:hypothetical protein
MPHALDDRGQDDRAAKDFTLVDQVRQSVRVCFGPELVTGAITLIVEDVVDPLPQFTEQVAAHRAREHDKPLIVELALFRLRHRRRSCRGGALCRSPPRHNFGSM